MLLCAVPWRELALTRLSTYFPALGISSDQLCPGLTNNTNRERGCSLVMSVLALVPVLVLTVLPHWHWQYGHPVLLWCLNWTVNTKCSLHKADSWMSDNDEGGFCDKKLRLACGNRWGLLAQLATRSREQTKVSFNFIWEFPQFLAQRNSPELMDEEWSGRKIWVNCQVWSEISSRFLTRRKGWRLCPIFLRRLLPSGLSQFVRSEDEQILRGPGG